MTFSGVDLEPNGNYMIWFPDDFTFKGKPGDFETLKVDIVAANDEYSGNDTRSLLLDYCAPEELPYSSMSHLAIDKWGCREPQPRLLPFRTGPQRGCGIHVRL